MLLVYYRVTWKFPPRHLNGGYSQTFRNALAIGNTASSTRNPWSLGESILFNIFTKKLKSLALHCLILQKKNGTPLFRKTTEENKTRLSRLFHGTLLSFFSFPFVPLFVSFAAIFGAAFGLLKLIFTELRSAAKLQPQHKTHNNHKSQDGTREHELFQSSESSLVRSDVSFQVKRQK